MIIDRILGDQAPRLCQLRSGIEIGLSPYAHHG